MCACALCALRPQAHSVIGRVLSFFAAECMSIIAIYLCERVFWQTNYILLHCLFLCPTVSCLEMLVYTKCASFKYAVIV